MQETRRTDLTIGVSYETNIKEVKDIIIGILNANEKILKHPFPAVSVRELTDSGIKIAIRAWTKNEHFGDVTSEIFEDCKTAFDQAKIDYQPFVRETSR
jgi:small conductance mechanosensitive channel